MPLSGTLEQSHFVLSMLQLHPSRQTIMLAEHEFPEQTKPHPSKQLAVHVPLPATCKNLKVYDEISTCNSTAKGWLSMSVLQVIFCLAALTQHKADLEAQGKKNMICFTLCGAAVASGFLAWVLCADIIGTGGIYWAAGKSYPNLGFFLCLIGNLMSMVACKQAVVPSTGPYNQPTLGQQYDQPLVGQQQAGAYHPMTDGSASRS
eukprot:g3325.t1